VFSNLFSITLPNIGKYFPGIHFQKINYFPANKWGKDKESIRIGVQTMIPRFLDLKLLM
jgi:hypothetical protein